MQEARARMGRNATIGYYDREAEAFARDTAHACVSEALDEFTALLPAGSSVLDWGCGTGRDSRAMLDMGLAVTSTDASKSLCKKAAELFGVEVACERFEDLSAEGECDGIWACASLLHVKKSELPAVLQKAKRALRAGGILYASFKHGSFEGMRNGRFFTDLDEEALSELVKNDFDIMRLWVTRDVRPGREKEKWLNCLLRRRS